MSTRSTIALVNYLHVYEEVINRDICFEFDSATRINPAYGDPCVSLDEFIELYKKMGEFIYYINTNRAKEK